MALSEAPGETLGVMVAAGPMARLGAIKFRQTQLAAMSREGVR